MNNFQFLFWTIMFQYHCGGGVIITNVQLGGSAQSQNAWIVPVKNVNLSF
jgi:hypothetical protein